jgi:hypothetical protein
MNPDKVVEEVWKINARKPWRWSNDIRALALLYVMAVISVIFVVAVVGLIINDLEPSVGREIIDIPLVEED